MRIKIVNGTTKISSKGDIIFHSFDGDIEFNALGKNNWNGEKGNDVGGYEELPISTQPNLNRYIVEFYPPKNFDWSFGFDWMREGKDNKINFKNLCSNFVGLQKEYKAKKLELSLWKNKPKDKEYSYDSWLAIYPPNAQNYGSSKATLSLLTYSDEDMKTPLKVVYDKTYFKVDKESLLPLKKSNKGQLLKNALTVECIAGFSTEQEIKIMTEENQEIGCLRVVPNDDNHRYKLKIRLVKVYLLEEDKGFLNSQIKQSDVKKMLNQGYLSQCFLRPIVEPIVQELDLTSQSTEWESYRKEIPIKDTEQKEKVIDSVHLDRVHSKIRRAYYDENPDEQGNSNHNLIFFFINHKVVLYKEWEEGGLKNQSWDGTQGYTQMQGKASLIMKNGVDTHTLCHEALHARGLYHTFSEEGHNGKYIFTKYKTDNVMDYAEENENNAQLKASYKWQWDKIREVAEKTNVHIKLEKESENEE